MEGILSQINPRWESNRFCFHTSERNKEILKQKAKEAFAKEYNLDVNNLTIEFGATHKNLILRVGDQQLLKEVAQAPTF